MAKYAFVFIPKAFFIIDWFPNINFHNGSEYYKNNKNSALIPQYTHKFFSGSAKGHILKFFWIGKRAYIKIDICELLDLFLQFYYYRKCYVPFLLNVRWMLFILQDLQ